MTQNTNKESRLIALPGELRNKIYANIPVFSAPVDILSTSSIELDRIPGFYQTCKQPRDEGRSYWETYRLEHYYSSNTFLARVDCLTLPKLADWLNGLGRQEAAVIQEIVIMYEPGSHEHDKLATCGPRP